MEGIGTKCSPLFNLCNYVGMTECLMECSVNGEVIYEMEDNPVEAVYDIINRPYRPFVEEGKMWVSGLKDVVYPELTAQNYIVYDYFDGDTVVNGIGCKRWIERFVPRDAPGAPILTYTMSAYEENGKVWLFHEGETTPRLIYDFLAEPGESIVVYSAQPDIFRWSKEYGGTSDLFFEKQNDTLTILSKKIEDFCGGTQRITYYASKKLGNGNEWRATCFIEGVGAFSGPVANVPSIQNHLAYCLVGDEILFCNEDMANFWDIPDPTAVHAPHVVSDSKMTWTDLSGRQFSTPPARKGIYIRGGRKVMVK